MAKFLVYIPSPAPGMPNLQIKVEAENWMIALQLGRQKVGEKTELGSNIMCDFKEDGSVEITDPNTGRAFSIKEIEDSQPQAAPQQPAQQAQTPKTAVEQPKPVSTQPSPQVAPPPAPVKQPEPKPAQEAPKAPVSVVTTPKVEIKKDAQPARIAAAPVAPTIKVAPEEIRKKSQTGQYQPVEKPVKKIDANIEEVKEIKEPQRDIGRKDTKLSSNIESIMTSLFTEVYEVYNNSNTREDAANFMLDLAMKKIGAEAGSILYADLSETDLSFIATRGPKSEELKKFKVPIGKGIVGFCVDVGVSLAISDVSKDKRWFDKISKSIGFPTRSILCAPIQYEGQTLGAIELINKKDNTPFNMDDLNILNYIAHETGDAFIRIEGKNQNRKA